MGKRPLHAAQYCDEAWTRLNALVFINEDQKTPFTNACLAHAEIAKKSSPADQCFWQYQDDHFVLGRRKAMLPASKDDAVSCLAVKARFDHWVTLAKPNKDNATGKAQTATPAPVASTPAPASVPLPDAVTPSVALPSNTTATSDDTDGLWATLKKLPYSVEGSGGVRVTSMGLSVNGTDPVKSYMGGQGGMLRLSTYLTPKFFEHNWNYETQVFVQGQLDNLDSPLGTVWNVGGGAAARFIYNLSTSSVVIAPEVYAGEGTFLQKDPTDVGIPGRAYWASNSYTFPLVAAALGVYLQIPTNFLFDSGKMLKFTFGFRSGMRWLFHKDSVTNLPAGMPKGTAVSLTSPMMEAIQGVFGVRF